MKKRTVEPTQRDRVDREEVAGHDARRLLAEELAPGGRGAPRPRRGLDAVGLEHSCDRACRRPMPEVKQLTSDALVPPRWIVGRHRHDQRGELVGDLWPAELTLGVRPVSGDEATVPAKEGLGLRRTLTSARAPRAGSALRARPDRPVGGRAAAGCGAGSRARGATPGSRSPKICAYRLISALHTHALRSPMHKQLQRVTRREPAAQRPHAPRHPAMACPMQD